MPRLNRREALALGGAAAGWALCPLPLGRGREDLFELARAIRETPRDAVLESVGRRIRGGLDVPTLLGAVFLAGVQDIRPRPHGILHAVMMVESSFLLAEGAPPAEAWLLALWNLDDFKRSQERDAREDGDWLMPPSPEVTRTSPDRARAELRAALEAWDVERADRAIVALLPHQGHASLFEDLWLAGARCAAFIGHKLIYTVQVERALRRVGRAAAGPALRSLVRALLVDRDTTTYERSRELAPSLAGFGAKEDPAESERLFRALRACDAERAQDLMVAACESGLGPRTVWDALRLHGSDIFHRRPGRTPASGRDALLPVHALTVTNAFGHAWRTTRDESTRRVLILQAAAWSAAIREWLAGNVGPSMEGAGIEALGEGNGQADRARKRLDTEPAYRPTYLRNLRSALCEKGREHHQHKYAAAMQEESSLAHPTWASRILAPAVEYLASPADVETELHARCVRVLREAGVL